MFPLRRSLVSFASIFLLPTALPIVARAEEMVQANHVLVIAGHPAATKLGLETLDHGGNAIDALVTVSLALGVAEPGNSGLGGKIVLIYYDATTHKTTAVVAMDSAPAAMLPDKVLAIPAEKRQRGWDTCCTPGLAAALGQAQAKWGTRSWKEDVEPAVKLATDGVTISDRMGEMLSQFHPEIDHAASAIYAPDGKPLAAGKVLKNPDLAHTLQIMADQGYASFYHGEIADRLAAAAQANGGFISRDDLANYQPRFLEPLTGTYHGYTVATSPPPLTGGATLLASLECLADQSWTGTHPRDAKYIDSVSRVLEQVFPQVAATAADFPESFGRVEQMLAPENIKAMETRAHDSDPRKPTLKSVADAGLDCPIASSTTHLIIIDSKGDIACCTQSLGLHFGADVVAPGDGFLMNADLGNFSLTNKQSKNYLAPGRWPRSTMTPTIVFKDGKPILAIGSPASDRIPTAVLQVTLDVLDFHRPLEDAIRAPRFHLRHANPDANDLDIESQSDPALDATLTKMGWQPHRRDDSDFYFGSVNAALIDGSHVTGVADQRRTSDVGGQ